MRKRYEGMEMRDEEDENAIRGDEKAIRGGWKCVAMQGWLRRDAEEITSPCSWRYVGT